MLNPARVVPLAGNLASATAGAAATVNLAAPGATLRWAVSGIFFSYDTAPTGGQLTFSVGGVAMIDVYVNSAGAGFIPFDRPMIGAANQAMSLVLAGGGGSVKAKCGFIEAWTENATPLG